MGAMHASNNKHVAHDTMPDIMAKPGCEAFSLLFSTSGSNTSSRIRSIHFKQYLLQALTPRTHCRRVSMSAAWWPRAVRL